MRLWGRKCGYMAVFVLPLLVFFDFMGFLWVFLGFAGILRCCYINV